MKILKEVLSKGVQITLRETRRPIPLESGGTIFYEELRCFVGEEDVTQELRNQESPLQDWFEWLKNQIDREEETGKA